MAWFVLITFFFFSLRSRLLVCFRFFLFYFASVFTLNPYEWWLFYSLFGQWLFNSENAIDKTNRNRTVFLLSAVYCLYLSFPRIDFSISTILRFCDFFSLAFFLSYDRFTGNFFQPFSHLHACLYFLFSIFIHILYAHSCVGTVFVGDFLLVCSLYGFVICVDRFASLILLDHSISN